MELQRPIRMVRHLSPMQNNRQSTPRSERMKEPDREFSIPFIIFTTGLMAIVVFSLHASFYWVVSGEIIPDFFGIEFRLSIMFWVLLSIWIIYKEHFLVKE